MIREHLTSSLRAALASLGVAVTGEIGLEQPARREHGDWSSNVVMANAKRLGRVPRELATELADTMNGALPDHVDRVELAGPGFVNFHLAPSWLHDVLVDVVTAGTDQFARSQMGAGERVMIEFVSANPTGPVHVGNGWFASYGDALGRLFERTGHEVAREYYVNDTGGQIRRLGATVLAHVHGEAVPDDGYPGEYVAELAQRYDADRDGGNVADNDVTAAGQWAAAIVLDGIKATMSSINIDYDEWFSQASIEDSAAVADTLAIFDEKGLLSEEDGALWLATADFGDPRERRVLRKSNGDYTYLAGDLAYHRNKFLIRGFDRVINVWGADHHGQVASLLAGVEALGVDRGRLEVRLGQMVSLSSGSGSPGARMSKRAGNVVDLDELVADIGPDVVRLLSLLASIDQPTTIDIDRVRSESRDSPVFYVQYAHARISSIGRVAAERGIERRPLDSVDLSLLTHERELELLRTLFALPWVVESATAERAPHKVGTWVRELADRFHGFYHDCYVMGEGVDAELTQARLWLVESARIGFAVGLDLLGVAAPESM